MLPNGAGESRTRSGKLDALTVITAGPITVDTRYRASVHGRPIALTTIEHRLLVTLLRRRGRTLSRVWLHQNLWKGKPTDDTRTVDMTVSRLRAKLGRAASLIRTVHGVGYRFNDAPTRR